MAMTQSMRREAGEWALPDTNKGLFAYYYNATENLKRRGAARNYYAFSGRLTERGPMHRAPTVRRRTKLDAWLIGTIGSSVLDSLAQYTSAAVIDEDIDNSGFTVPVGGVNVPAPVVDEALLEKYRQDERLVTFHGYLLCRDDNAQVALLMKLPGNHVQRYILSNETGKWMRVFEPLYDMLRIGHTIQVIEWH